MLGTGEGGGECCGKAIGEVNPKNNLVKIKEVDCCCCCCIQPLSVQLHPALKNIQEMEGDLCQGRWSWDRSLDGGESPSMSGRP